MTSYVERDARLAGAIGDLAAFARFVGLCAGRSGQLLNLTSLGSDTGVTCVTASRWPSILSASYIVKLLQPHHERFTRRLVKAPKLYFLDTGLMCALLGVRSGEDLRTHPVRGSVFETFVVSELTKLFVHRGERAPCTSGGPATVVRSTCSWSSARGPVAAGGRRRTAVAVPRRAHGFGLRPGRTEWRMSRGAHAP